MKKISVTYRDITGEERAAERANHAPALRGALLDLGFQSIGILECKAPGAVDYEAMKNFVKAEDLAMMAEATENGEVEEVLTSHDRMMFATVDRFFSGPVIVLRTIFENGVVVETVTRPKRGALPAENPPVLPLVDGLARKTVFNSMPLWARENRPRWGYYVELVDTSQPSELWQRHRQRIDELAKTLQTSTRPQDALPLYIALSRRSHQITEYVGNWQSRFTTGAVAVFMLFLLVVVLQMKGLMAVLNERLGYVGAMSTLLLGVIFLAILMLPLSMGLPKLAIPLLPGPPLRPVAELLQ